MTIVIRMKNPPRTPPSTGASTLWEAPLLLWSEGGSLCEEGLGTIIVVGGYVCVLVTHVKITGPSGSVVGT